MGRSSLGAFGQYSARVMATTALYEDGLRDHVCRAQSGPLVLYHHAADSCLAAYCTPRDPVRQDHEFVANPSGPSHRSGDSVFIKLAAKRVTQHAWRTSMARLGSSGRPATARVQTLERAHEIVSLCDRHEWKVIVGVEPDKPEDVSDVAQLLNGRPQPIVAAAPSRSAPCPCGSGRKYKRCCGK